MKTFALTALAALAMAGSQTAHAGAIGTVATAGFHQERAYYYTRQGEQHRETQLRFNSGLGIEALVGDKVVKRRDLAMHNQGSARRHAPWRSLKWLPMSLEAAS